MKPKYSLLITLPLFIYFYISFYCNPIADDFTFAVVLHNHTLWEGTKFLYLGTTGRYFSNFLMIINPITFDLSWLYKILPIIILLITLFTIYIFLKEITNSIYKTKNYFLTSVIILLTYLVYMPNIAEGIYWYTGYATYHLSLIFFLIYQVSIIKLFKQTKNWYLWQTISIIILFITIGFNEVIMGIILVTLLIINALHFSVYKKINWTLFHLICAIIFSLLVILSPGTDARESYYANNHKIFDSLTMSIFQTIRFSAHWFSASLVILSIIFIPINNTLSKSIYIFKNSFFLTPFKSILFLLTLVFISSFLPYYATGILGQHRTLNLAYFIFIFFWFINLSIWYNFYNVSFDIQKYNHLIKPLIFFLLIIFSFTNNSYLIVEDIFYKRHTSYNEQMKERLIQIDKAESDTIYLEKLRKTPKSIFVMDVTSNPNDWVNRGYLIYRNKQDNILIGSN